MSLVINDLSQFILIIRHHTKWLMTSRDISRHIQFYLNIHTKDDNRWSLSWKYICLCFCMYVYSNLLFRGYSLWLTTNYLYRYIWYISRGFWWRSQFPIAHTITIFFSFLSPVTNSSLISFSHSHMGNNTRGKWQRCMWWQKLQAFLVRLYSNICCQAVSLTYWYSGLIWSFWFCREQIFASPMYFVW